MEGLYVVLLQPAFVWLKGMYKKFFLYSFFVRGRIISVGRALDCRFGGRGFDFQGWTITQGLKITEK